LAKILFITSRFPYPLNKGDKLRVFYQLKHLAEENDVHLIVINEKQITDKDLKNISIFCKTIDVLVLPLYKRIIQLFLSPFKQLPLQVAFFYNGKIKNEINKITEAIKPDFIHCHLIRTTEYVRGIKGIHKSLDFMDAFGKGMEKRQKTEPNIFKRLLFAYEKNLLYSYESKVFGFINSFCIISSQDKDSIKSPMAGNIKIVPNGVDFEMFYPRTEPKIYDLLFMGNLSYPPNIDAVLFLSNEIIPIVKKSKPDIKLLLAGIGAPNRIKKLQSENINLIENFNDISDSIAMSGIMLAPMRLSIGLQNKILQAMAMKTPCIVSSLSNNAIKAPDKIALLEANTPQEFSESILELLNDINKASAMGNAGYDFVKEHYSWSKQNELLTDLILNRN
jgi:polysaccharide biosynthesis protein PslH